MVLYPECQKLAQEEIERVIGTERLPELADRKALKYVQGVCWETMRCFPVVPLGKKFSATI